MSEPAPFASSPDGALLICGDGPELLVYHGSGQPAWKAFCDGVLVGCGASRDAVVTLDADGKLTWFRSLDGTQLEEAASVGEPADLSVAGDGRVAVAGPDGVALVLRGGEPHLLPIPGASCVAFGPDGNSLGVGTSAGVLQAMDPASGAAWGQVELGVPVTGVAWSALGVWVVTAGNALFVVSGDGTTIVARVDAEGPLTQVTVADHGVLAAARLGHNQVAVFELNSNRRVGQIDLRRRIGGLGFGVGGRIGIGLDDGDASVVDLQAGGGLRTEPHQGRGRNNWNLDVRVDTAAIRGALARNRAGGTAIAAYTGWRPEDEQEGGRWKTCLGAALGCGFLLFSCVSCSVLVYALRAFGYL